jgi:hypothetical protein
MASSDSIKFVSVEAKKTCILSEDIPGAKLPRETVEEGSVVQLKSWLVCRGAKTSGKKGPLVSRYDI